MQKLIAIFVLLIGSNIFAAYMSYDYNRLSTEYETQIKSYEKKIHQLNTENYTLENNYYYLTRPSRIVNLVALNLPAMQPIVSTQIIALNNPTATNFAGQDYSNERN